jgi:pilus assembly protein CpaB
VLFSLAIACGALAASTVQDRIESVERRVGPLVPVAVAARDLPAGRRLAPRDVQLRRVPEAYLPPDALAPATIAEGGRTAVPVRAGSYLTPGLLGGRRAARDGILRRGQRLVDVAVAGASPLASAPPGARVDVMVSTEPRVGPRRTFVAVEGAELLALRPAGEDVGPGTGDGAAGAASAVATLRVTLRQAVNLTAAQNFGREVRLLARPPGDRRRTGRAAVSADGL